MFEISQPLNTAPETQDENQITGNTLAYLLYASNSMGQTKAAAHTHWDMLHSNTYHTLNFESSTPDHQIII